MEQWKSIIEYEGKYEVSSQGRVRCLVFVNRVVTRKRECPMLIKLIPSRNYHRVSLSLGGHKRWYFVHLLVLRAFVGPCPVGCEGSHKDGNGQNNYLSNLVWETHSENERRKTDASFYAHSGFKKCKGCLKKLPVGDFYFHNATVDGFRPKCKKCLGRQTSARRIVWRKLLCQL